MKKLIFLLTILLAIFLRFNRLSSNPPSLDWDEASLGYNAYSILKTGADEYGNWLPLSFRSFDDYKPPVYVYLTVPFVAIFGLNELAVRLPSAITGILTVVLMYFLVKEFLQKKEKKYQEAVALTAAFFLTISPWHLQFSRAAFEGNVGLFFLMLGLWLFLRGLREAKLLILSSLSFVLSLYSYHSFRLLIPVFLLILSIIFGRALLKKRLVLTISFILLVVLSSPVYLSLGKTQGSGSRLSTVSIFSQPAILDTAIKRTEYDKSEQDSFAVLFHNRRIVYFLAIAKGYLDHFNPDFLFFHGDGGLQHHAADFGMLYLWDLPFILLGLHILLKQPSRELMVLFLLFLLAPVPASLTTGTPHPVRAIAMVPGFHIFAAMGAVMTIAKLWQAKQKLLKLWLPGVIIFSLAVNVSYYFHQYYVHTPIEYGFFWQYGYKEIIQYAKEQEAKVDKIVITYQYDQPYIYYLFYNKIDPLWYQKNWDYSKTGRIERFIRIIGKYEFRNLEYGRDSLLPNTLLIGTPEEIPDTAKIIKEVNFPDGRVAFRIVKT